MLLQQNLPQCWLPASKTCSCLPSLVPVATVVSAHGNSYNLSEKAFFISVLWFPEEVSWETSLTPLKQTDICGTTAFCVHLRGHQWNTSPPRRSGRQAAKELIVLPLNATSETLMQKNPSSAQDCKETEDISSSISLSQKSVQTDFHFPVRRKGGERIHPLWMLLVTPETLVKFITWPCTVHGRH